MLLGGLVRERCGIHYRDDDYRIAESKLQRGAQEAGFTSLLDYYYFLRYDDPTGAGFTALVDHLVVNETYFFREHVQLERAIERVVRPLVELGLRPRVWSLACSTGEEPISIAILLAEAGLLDHVDLLASDISGRSLEKAAAGLHSARSLRGTPRDALLDKWCTRDGASLVTSTKLRQTIRWSRKNLTAPLELLSEGCFELIFCRNALIYFDDDTVATVVRALAAALVPGGVLCVGVSESLHCVPSVLACEEQGGAFFYRRPQSA